LKFRGKAHGRPDADGERGALAFGGTLRVCRLILWHLRVDLDTLKVMKSKAGLAASIVGCSSVFGLLMAFRGESHNIWIRAGIAAAAFVVMTIPYLAIHLRKRQISSQ